MSFSIPRVGVAWARSLAGFVLAAILASVLAVLFPARAQAAAVCSASTMSQFMAFNGTPAWADFTSFAGCSNPSTTGLFAICTAPGQQAGSGGSAITPWRQLAGSGASLQWQLFDAGHATPVTGPGVQLGAIDFTSPFYGSTQIAYSALIPVNATLINGHYATTLLIPLELRQGSCSGPLETSFTFTFSLEAGVSTYCQITGTQGLSFGAGRATTTQTVDAIGGITVQCYWGSFTVALGDGQHASAGQRRVSNGTDTLAYDIYTTASRTIPWQGATTVTATSNGAPTSLSLYGRMPAQPTPSPGHYTDTVIASVTF